jgi:hypothetical protein
MSLLDEINLRIETYGGNDRLIYEIEKEWAKSFIHKNSKTSTHNSYTEYELDCINKAMNLLSSVTKRSKRSLAAKIYSLSIGR